MAIDEPGSTARDPLADLIREAMAGDRCHLVRGAEWYGWWTGRIPHDRQLFVAFGGKGAFGGQGIYTHQWHRMTHPELADPNAGGPAIFLATFDPAGERLEVRACPNPLRIDPSTHSPVDLGSILDANALEGLEAFLRRFNPQASLSPTTKAAGPLFDVGELETFLRAEFGAFERGAIRVKPFKIPEIGLELRPLYDMQVDYLDDPERYDEEERESIRLWIEGGCSELLFGNDYWLGDDGGVTSS